jgi:hypothetical protein
VETVEVVVLVVLVRQELPLSLVLTEVVQVEDLVALVDQEEVEVMLEVLEVLVLQEQLEHMQ